MKTEKKLFPQQGNCSGSQLPNSDEKSTTQNLLLSFKDEKLQKNIFLRIEIPFANEAMNRETILLNLQFGDTKFHMDLPTNYQLKDFFNFIQNNENILNKLSNYSEPDTISISCGTCSLANCCKTKDVVLLNCQNSLHDLIFELRNKAIIVVANQWDLYCGVFSTKTDVTHDFQCSIIRAYLDEALTKISPLVTEPIRATVQNEKVTHDTVTKDKALQANPIENQTYYQIQKKLLALSKKIKSSGKQLDESEKLFIKESCVFLRKVQEMKFA